MGAGPALFHAQPQLGSFGLVLQHGGFGPVTCPVSQACSSAATTASRTGTSNGSACISSSGAMMMAVEKGIPIHAVMAMGCWQSPGRFAPYVALNAKTLARADNLL
uniref:Uncharacterized protein n=1 Tax=Plectus sambesii TaxID=2011161 RepID=A0A914VTP8_9BILA